MGPDNAGVECFKQPAIPENERIYICWEQRRRTGHETARASQATTLVAAGEAEIEAEQDNAASRAYQRPLFVTVLLNKSHDRCQCTPRLSSGFARGGQSSQKLYCCSNGPR